MHFIGLNGPVGSGKTTLTKALAVKYPGVIALRPSRIAYADMLLQEQRQAWYASYDDYKKTVEGRERISQWIESKYHDYLPTISTIYLTKHLRKVQNPWLVIIDSIGFEFQIKQFRQVAYAFNATFRMYGLGHVTGNNPDLMTDGIGNNPDLMADGIRELVPCERYFADGRDCRSQFDRWYTKQIPFCRGA